MSETACACYKVEEIPAPSAKANYSCTCFRQSLGRLLCISDLRDTFDFSETDLKTENPGQSTEGSDYPVWSPEIIPLTTGDNAENEEDGICGGDVSTGTGSFISFISSVQTIANGRGWIGSLCGDASTTTAKSPALLYGPATPPYHALNALAVPPFVPASSGGGGKKPEIGECCYWLGRYLGGGKVQLYVMNSSGTKMEAKTIVDCYPL